MYFTHFETNLKFASTPWEDNQLGLVSLQPLYISLKTFQRTIPPSMINCYPNSWCKFLGNVGSLLRVDYKKSS